MVEFSLDTNIRATVHFLLAAVSIVLCYFAYTAMAPTTSDLAKLARISTTFAVYGFLLWLFNRFVWRWRLVRLFHRIPDLNGRWQGTIVRGDEPSDVRHITAKIIQNWHNIAIDVEAANSRSTLKTAALLTRGGSKEILYSYTKVPLSTATGKFGEGFQQLMIEDGERKLSGRYFSTRLRGGITTLERES